ncbi:hypothetical protein Nepgr_009786 [Nepenthes gracilis]|uniref:Uncharacterized protein n=1 Tax=Nepenthes gracilis TaxID=150966 RepID=A0AAD3SBT0_NEPGR|nr:hypothetical protein Nepgr_009786 [Nepenthes gracilis]
MRDTCASWIHDEVVPIAVVTGGCGSEATVVEPMRFLRAPPGFEMEGASTSSRGQRPRRVDPALQQVAWAVAECEARVSRPHLGYSGGVRAVLGALSREEHAWLETELRSRLRPEEVASALEGRIQDGIRLNWMLARLEEPDFRIGVLDSRNSSVRTCAHLSEFTAPNSSGPSEGE